MEDDILLQALLIHSIQYDNFSDVKKEDTKYLNILSKLKKEHQAIEAGESLHNSATTIQIKSQSRTIRRGSKGNTVGKPNGSTTDKRTTFWAPYIPNWPQGFRNVCTDGLWNQINVWKSLVNKLNENSNEKQRL